MQSSRRFSQAVGIIGMALCAMLFVGCTPGAKSRTEVKECSTYNNDEAACDNAKTAAGVKCYYANQTCSEVPRPSQATGTCADLSAHKDRCESRMDCKYTNNTCEDATPASCGNVKVEDACKNVFKAFCAWDGAAKTCQAKSGLVTDIYKWKQLAMPTADTTTDELSSFVVSKDNQHLYVLGNHNNQRGLYHSADGGATWARLGDNNGALSVRPKPAAAPTTIAAGLNIQNLELKPTASGVVVFLPDNANSKIISIDGATLKWGLQGVTHGKGAAQNLGIANVHDQNISFVDVSPDGTIVYFGYEQHNTNWGQYSQLLAADDGGAGITVTTKQVHNTNDQALVQKAWSRIGFAGSGDMLLFSNWTDLGVYRVAQAELANPNPKLVIDAPVLFPENAQPWPDNQLRVLALYAQRVTVAGNPADVHMAVLKDQTPYSYVAHFAGVQGTGDSTINGGGGTGPGHASISYNGKLGVGFTAYNGILRLVTASNGILGLKPDGGEDYLSSYSLGFINAKTEMMADGSNVTQLGLEQNSKIEAIYGDDSLTYYLIAGKGMWSRTAEQGQPRP